MDLGLKGKVALVTGASRGIGRACVEALLAEGAQVFAVALTAENLEELAAATGVAFAACDLSTTEGCERAYAEAVRQIGRVDVLVNCAGAAPMGNVLSLTRDEVDDSLGLKFHGYLRMAQLVAPAMAERGWGRIVNISGVAGTSPTADNLPTSLANIAIHNLSRSLSDELAGRGVLVNIVSPGLTLTDRATDLLGQYAAAQGITVEDAIAHLASQVPAGRVANPEEVARAVCFLASDANSYTFGSVLYMDGGSRRATP